MARKKLSLGEKIALAASGNQEEDYPEDIEYDTSAKVIELDEDYDSIKPVARSSLRAKNVQLLDEFDEKYSGEKVSRKNLTKEDGLSVVKKRVPTSEEEDDDDDDDSLGDEDELDESDVEEEEDGASGDSAEEEEDDESEGVSNEEDDSEAEDTGASGMQTLSIRDKEAEIEKGRATLNQIRIWDSLLEVRIRQQKMLLDCSKLPHTDMYEELISDIVTSGQSSTLPKIIEKSQEATKTLMHELLRLQEIMTARNSETKKALSKKVQPANGEIDDPMNEEITSSEDESDKHLHASPPKGKRKNGAHMAEEQAKKMKLEDFNSAAEAGFSNFITYRNQTIQKWNDKTQFAGGKFNKKTASQQISTLRQIEQILSNKERLLKRTQVKRSIYSVIGEPCSENLPPATEQDPDPEVFDDDDFYHQLLRELIERKTCNVNDPTQLSRHWLELQKLRTKLKRKVDTKASKGRKIRYDVHAKLVNFMAPQENCKMSSTAVKELFGSLFGKTKDQQEQE